jgi:hypothetical protein
MFLIKPDFAGTVVVREQLRVASPIDDGFELATRFSSRKR